MFDATEAINDIINDINVDYYESCYNAIYEELTERVESGELSLEEAQMINEAAADKYLTEGANLEARKLYKEEISKYKTEIKAAVEAKKKGDCETAINHAEKAKSIAMKLKDDIGNLDPENVGSAVLGWIASSFITNLKAFIVGIPTLGIGSMVLGIKFVIDCCQDIYNATKKADLKPNDFNKYINDLRRCCDKLAKSADKLIASCKKGTTTDEKPLENLSEK